MVHDIYVCFQLDALEYIHNQDYVHADIKASNLLTGYVDEQNVSIQTVW
jgi:serine/threonine protein kinase